MFRRFDNHLAQGTARSQVKSRALKRKRVNLDVENLESRQLLAVDVWTGASSNLWSDNGNWQDNSAPVAGDDLVFPSSATNKTSVYDSGLGVSSFASIDIQDSGYDISTSFGSLLTLTNGLSATYGSSISNFDISFDPGNGLVSVGTGATLSSAGVISGTSGLMVSGGGTFQTAGTSSNTYTGTTTVDTGATFVLDKSSATAIPGDLTISAGGTVQLAQSDQIADASGVSVGTDGALDLNNFDDAIGALSLTGATVSSGTGTLTLGGDVTTIGSPSVSLISGNLDLGGATRTFTIGSGTPDPDVFITANISGIGAGLIVAGSVSRLDLSGNNTYDGTTTLSSGVLSISGINALGATTAGTVVQSGASLTFVGGLTFAAEPITISGIGVAGILGALNNLSGSNTLTGPITLAANSSILVNSGTTLTIASQITDGASSFTLTKTGTGTLALTNANPYEGGTTVSAGTIQASNDGSLGTGAVSVSNGAALELSGGISLANSSFNVRGSGVSGNGVLRSTSGSNTIAAPITLAGDTTVNVASGSRLDLDGDVGGGSFVVFKAGLGTLDLGATNSMVGLFLNAGTSLVNGTTLAPTNGIAVNSGATLGGTGTVGTVSISSGGSLAPGESPGILNSGDVTFVSGSTFSVEIDGTTLGTQYDQLNVTGTVDLGNATLSPSGGYAYVLNDAFTVINNDGSDAIVGTFNGLAEGASFELGVATYTVSYVGGDGNDVVLTVTSITYTWDGGGGDSNWTSAANWVGDVVPSAGASLVFPAGASRLSNVNDFAANTNFNNVTIAAAGYTIGGNALDLDGDFLATYASGSSEVSADIVLQSTREFDVATGGTLDMTGVITVSTFIGGYGVTKNGGGTLRYSGSSANLYNGGTTINAGSLVLAKADNVIASNGSVTIGDNTVSATLVLEGDNQFWVGSDVTVNEGSIFEVGTFEAHISNLNLQGATTQIDTGGLLALFVGVNSFTTTNNVTSNVQGLGALEIDNTQNTFTVADDVSVDVDLRISTIVQGSTGTSGINKDGLGTLALSGDNTFGGEVSLNTGVVLVESDNALGSTTGATTISSGASVYFSGGDLSIAENFSIAGNGVSSDAGVLSARSDTATLTGNITMTGNAQIGTAVSSTLTINGVIDDGGSTYDLTVLSHAIGEVVLGGDNLFDGNVTVSSGFLELTHSNALGDPTATTSVNVDTFTALLLSGGITIPATKSITLTNQHQSGPIAKLVSLSGDNTIAGSVTLAFHQTIGAESSATLTIEGAIGESGGSRMLFKEGPGNVVLSGTSTYTGSTTISDGTLRVNGSIATSSSLTAASGATLGGSGTLPAVSISSNGTLSPGNSPGILNTGDLAFTDSGSTYAVELNGATVGTEYDQTNVTGTVTLAGATLSTSLGYTPAVATAFTIINNDSTDAVTGTFNGLAEGSTITIGIVEMTISYVGGDGNDVVLTVTDVTYTWSGAEDNGREWSLGTNWVGGIAPTPGSNLVFPDSPVRAESLNDFASATAFYSITIAGSGYDIYGNAILLTNSLTSTHTAGSASFGLDTNLTTAMGTSFTIAAGGTVELNATLSGNALLKEGAGTLLFGGGSSNTHGATILHDGLLVLNKANGATAVINYLEVGLTGGPSSVRLDAADQIADLTTVRLGLGSTFDLNGFNAETGYLELNGSSVLIGTGGVLTPTSMVALAASTAVGSTITGGTLDLGANGTFSLVVTDNVLLPADVELEISSVIANGGLTIVGGGDLGLTGSNTYDGNTQISGTRVFVGSDTAFGSSVGSTSVSGGSVVFYAPGLEIAEDFSILGTGISNEGILWVGLGDATLTGTIVLTGDGQIGAVSDTSLTINGVISGGFALAVTNGASGVTTLGGTSIYSGGTTINSGTLSITNSSALGTGLVTVGDGTATSGHLELDLTGTNFVTNSFLFNAPITTGLQVNSGTTTFLGGTTLVSNVGIHGAAGTSLAFAGPISDVGQTRSLTKGGAGTLSFSGINTYTGTTFVDEGLLLLDTPIAIINGDLVVSGPGTAATVRELQGNGIADGVTVTLANAGATLDLNGFSDTIGALSLTGSTVTTGDGTLTIASGGSISTLASSQTATISGNLAFGGPNNFITVAEGTTESGVDLDVSAVVSSIFNIIKDGEGSMAFSGANTYSGGTNINAGVLAISNDTGAGTGVVNILATGNLDLSGGITVGNTLNVASSGTAISNSVGTNTLSGSITLGTDSTFDTVDTSTLVISGTIDDSSSVYALTKTGAGTLQLDAANTYAGGTTVAAGILAISNNDSLGTGNVLNSAQIDISNNLLIHNNFTLNSAGTAFLVDGLTTIDGTINLLAEAAISLTDFSNLYLNGVISGGSGLAVNGNGTLGLGQANTYSGPTAINGGSLQIFNTQSTGASGGVEMFTGTTLIQSVPEYDLPASGLLLIGSSTFLVPLPSAYTLNGAVQLSGNATFDVATGGSLTINDEISDDARVFGLTKTGTGTLVLASNSTYTGSTTVSAGTLQVDGNLSSSAVTVASSSSLVGTGTVGDLTVSSGGSVAPGQSPGVLSSGDASFAAGSTFNVEINGTSAGTDYDQLAVAGTVTLTNPTLSVSLDFAPTPGVDFTIINNDGSDAVSGTFNGLPEGSRFSVGDFNFVITYVGGDGNDVVLNNYVITTTTLSSNASTTTYGQDLVLTAVVGSSFGTPTGTVSFYLGATMVGTVPVSGSTASLTMNNLSVGNHSFSAVYSGDFEHSTSTSGALAQTVTIAGTTTIFLASPNPAVHGQLTTFTAIVSAAITSAAAPSGSVSFFDGNALIGTAGLVGNQAILTAALFGVDQLHSIRAVYSGDSHYASSTSASANQTLNKANVEGFAEFVRVNRSKASLKALVKVSTPGGGVPTGTIVFRVNGVGFKRVQLVNGQASVKIPRIRMGSYKFDYRYVGDSNYNAMKAPKVVFDRSPFATAARATSAFATRRNAR